MREGGDRAPYHVHVLLVDVTRLPARNSQSSSQEGSGGGGLNRMGAGVGALLQLAPWEEAGREGGRTGR